MTELLELADPWKDDRARLRHERDAFKKRSTAKRKEWRTLKSSGRKLDALEAMTRMHEYAQSARRFQSALDALPEARRSRARSAQQIGEV